MPKVSIIIPVYNISDYLERCLNSVINQTFSDIEILVINDGSTDDSPKIIEDFANKDARIVAIHKENEGLAFARKTGIEQANSPFIMHLDGDDYYEPEAVETAFLNISNNKSDLCIFNFIYEYTDRSTASVKYPQKRYSNTELLEYLWKGRGYYAVWAHIHKKELYNNIQFDRSLSFGEDVYLTSQLVYYSKNIEVIESKPLLHYVIRDKSISNTYINPKKVEDILRYPQLLNGFMASKPEFNKMKESLACMKIIAYNTLLQRGWFKGSVQRSKETLLILEKYPKLIKAPSVRAFRKLFWLFAINKQLALVFAQYYKLKGKIY